MKIITKKIEDPILKNSLSKLKLLSKDSLWAYHPCVIKNRNNFYMFYTGKSLRRGISHHILLAKSSDLKNWEKCRDPEIIKTGNNGMWDSDFLAHAFVFQDKGKFIMLYDGSPRNNWLEEIGLAESKDLINWKKYKKNPVFRVGTNRWEKRHVSRCCIYKEKGSYYLYYAGHDGQCERIGLAKGKSIFKLKRFLNKPVLDLGNINEWDGKSISDPRVFKYRNKYIMFYTGMDEKGFERIGAALSEDLINWKKYKNNPILDVSRDGWDKVSACRGGVKVINDKIYLFYSGRRKLFYSIGLAAVDIHD